MNFVLTISQRSQMFTCDNELRNHKTQQTFSCDAFHMVIPHFYNCFITLINQITDIFMALIKGRRIRRNVLLIKVISFSC